MIQPTEKPRNWIVDAAIVGALIGGTITCAPVLGAFGAGKESTLMMIGLTALYWLPGAAFGCLIGAIVGVDLNSRKAE